MSELFKAITAKDANLLKQLLDSGKDANTKEGNETLILRAGSSLAPYEIFEVLISHGADVNYANSSDVTALLYSTYHPAAFEVIKLLIDSGADVNHSNCWKRTPLHNSCLNSNKLEVIKLLVNSKSDVNARERYDATPLHYTCQYPVEPEGVEFLCQAGAELNVQDNNNKTPLHYACEKKSKEKIKILIDYGANIEISDKTGKKPEDYLTEEEKIWFQSLNHFVLDFQNLLNNKELADMKITTKMGDIYFHKTIIMARLGKDKIEQFEKILHQKEKNEIEKVLKFIYTACIELEFREIVEEIFQELGISFVSKLGLKNLHEDLGKLYEDEESKDFTIIAGEEEIRAHKTILFARSQTFRGMFLSVVDDSNKVNDYRGFSLKALNNIVKFLYFDKFDFDNLSLNVLEEIEEGLDYYGIATSPVLLEQINRKMESLELK